MTENLSLREYVVRLEHEAEKSASHRVLENVDDLASRLNDKVREFGTLVAELKGIGNSKRVGQIDVERAARASKRSPAEGVRERKALLIAQEVEMDDSGRLPPIDENKQYPRLSLKATEPNSQAVEQLSANTDSPDLGPRPIAHLSDDATTVPPPLPLNLEHRRRRRDTMNREEFRQSQLELASSDVDTEHPPTQPTSGAKRKLGEGTALGALDVAKPVESAEFEFKRKASSLADRRKHASDKPLSGIREKPTRRTASTTVAAGRKVLGPSTCHHIRPPLLNLN